MTPPPPKSLSTPGPLTADSAERSLSPWSSENEILQSLIFDADNNFIATVHQATNQGLSQEKRLANAASIVRAVNRDHLFDEMVEALEDSNFVLKALMQQLYSWDNEPVVNVRGQLARNQVALAAAQQVQS